MTEDAVAKEIVDVAYSNPSMKRSWRGSGPGKRTSYRSEAMIKDGVTWIANGRKSEAREDAKNAKKGPWALCPA